MRFLGVNAEENACYYLFVCQKAQIGFRHSKLCLSLFSFGTQNPK